MRRWGQQQRAFVPGACITKLTSVNGIMRIEYASWRRHPFGWACLVLLAGLGFSQAVLRVPCFRGPLGSLGVANTSGAAKACHPAAALPLAGCSFSLIEVGSVSASSAAYRPVVAAAWYNTMYNKLQSWLGNQKHIIQFGCIGMVVALFIIWWRKT